MADNVIKKVIDMRKGKTAILPSIVTNPELTGEEESLKSVEINGKKFTIGGGDGQLNLVATGTYEKEEQEYVHYNLSQELESNKTYLVKYFSDGGVFISTSIIILSDEFNSKGTISVANSDATTFITSIRLTYTNIILENRSGTEMYDDDSFEVYELPYSL